MGVVRQRMAADGCAVTDETIRSMPVVVGYRARIRALTRIHIFAVAAEVERVDEASLRAYVDDVVNLGLERKGQWRGLQSGVIVLPILVTESVDSAAVALTQKAYRLNVNGFAAMAQPAVVDVKAGQVWTFRGTRLWGYAFNSLVKQLYNAYLPEPAAELS
ncbi:hypothetical protein SAMN05443287_10116 [Micromonospora phaseoli]|uniref:Uncharacterized protein n=1 Tax=Micromonospora phaseoli TaxID=1144548 RepID=A0A1H6RG88_9ACTN|nr:hypothetical protein [Micromonospora phaseoli]PZW03274.1 hypothetical protein CLV64_10116 [Micromonospora phaseoli]GIJ78392.1 hypothetical protein Xph01_28240 [Micromonospora phaseoli]SEI50202.1 hypothetical protein SAMN05443287_10116 [Micromonospora phaseoli]